MLLAGWGLALQAWGADQVKFETPREDRAEVVVYDVLGGMRPRARQEPLMSIRADKSVVLGNPSGSGKRIETRISDAELQDLLRFIVEQNRFFDFDAESVNAAIPKDAGGRENMFQIMDAPITVIRVQLRNRQGEARFYALSAAARRHPEIAALQRLSAVEKRLKTFMAWINVGGKQGAEAALKQVNARLRTEHPSIQTLSAADLDAAFVYPDGSTRAIFVRRKLNPHGELIEDIVAQIHNPLEGDPEINLQLRQSRPSADRTNTTKD